MSAPNSDRRDPGTPRRFVPSPDALSAHLAGEAVLLHIGTKRYYRLNDTGARVWAALEEGLDESQIIERLCAEFDVGADEAAREVARLLGDLAEAGLIAHREGGEA